TIVEPNGVLVEGAAAMTAGTLTTAVPSPNVSVSLPDRWTRMLLHAVPTTVPAIVRVRVGSPETAYPFRSKAWQANGIGEPTGRVTIGLPNVSAALMLVGTWLTAIAT